MSFCRGHNCAAARSTQGHGPHPPTHLTFSTRPLTFSNCSAAWSQSRVDVRHLSASCRKVVTAAAVSCEGGARMIPYPGPLLWLRCLMPSIFLATWTRPCALDSSLRICSLPGISRRLSLLDAHVHGRALLLPLETSCSIILLNTVKICHLSWFNKKLVG